MRQKDSEPKNHRGRAFFQLSTRSIKLRLLPPLYFNLNHLAIGIETGVLQTG